MHTDAGRYRFGADHGELLLRTSRTGLGRRAGHDLVIEATRWSGEATVGEGQDVEVEVEVEVEGLTVRAASGGIKPLTEHDRREIVRTMRGEKLLAANVQPVITFSATTVAGESEDFTITGELTIAGKARSATVRCAAQPDGRVRGSASVVQTHWGIRPYTAFFGALRLADEVGIEFDTALERVVD